jgi:uncharacterized protein (DUF849 family)
MVLACLLTGAISICALPAAEQPRESNSDNPKKVKKLSEEEPNRTLDALKDRCQKMLEMQIAVYDGTQGLHKVIEDAADKKPRAEDRLASLKLAADEKEIVLEAAKAIDTLEAELAAVAFPEVFREMRKDMKRVQRRLKNSDVGADTQAIEQDIIQTLREMVASFKSR